MTKLIINPFARDLITHAGNLTPEQQKTAQMSRIALYQGLMPVLPENKNFVMLSNGRRAVYLNSKTMSEGAFVTGLVQAGNAVGVGSDDILSKYTDDTFAMGICNTIQELTEKSYAEKTSKEINAIISQIRANVEMFNEEASEAKVHTGVKIAVVQQTLKDLDKLAEIAKSKEENSNEKE